MKKTIILSIGLLFLFSIAFAKEDNYGERFQNRILEQNQKMEQIKEQAQIRAQVIKETLSAKVNNIKDAQKREIATNLTDKTNEMSQKWTEHFNNVLNQLEAVLEKIQSRAIILQQNGIDITTVTDAIQNAKSDITTTREQVQTQAGKTYALNTIALDKDLSNPTTVNSASDQAKIMNNFRNQFKEIKDQIKQDLFFLRDGALKNAREAVRNALEMLKQVNTQ